MKRVLIVGSAEQSRGGVSSVIRLMKKMPVWEKYQCYWLGTQIQRNYAWKLWYAIKGNFLALCVILRYSIVHMHTTPDKLGLIIQLPILFLAKVLRRKVVLHLHVGNQLKTKKNSLFVFCLKRADIIILLANRWKTLFCEYYPMVNTPTKVIYNACEKVKEVEFAEKENIIIMAVYFDDNKAPDILLKAWYIIKDCYPEWKVILMGNGDVEKFQRMADEMGMSDSVCFPGYLTGIEKENVWRKASIYCMCSYEEGFPMVVLEAWMYGANVVTTPVGGLPDVIEEGRNCMTYDFGDYKALADCLRILMDNPERRKEMAVYSRQFVEEHFGMVKINERFEELFDSLNIDGVMD